MFFKRLVQWLCGKRISSVPSHSSQPRVSSCKTYSQRYEETSGLSDAGLEHLLVNRDYEGLPSGVAHRVAADRSDARAKAYSIDEPRPGRKTYAQRQLETNAMSTAQLQSLRAERKAQGKETGVIDRVLSERT